MQKTLASFAILLTVWTPLQAQQPFAVEPLSGAYTQSERPRGVSRLWKASVALLAASSVADVHSSWGRLEANPLLRGPNGRFSTQGVVLKTMIVSGVIGAQYLMLRNHPKASKYGAITNFLMAGAISAAAVSNYQRNWGAPRSSSVATAPTTMNPAARNPASFETPARLPALQ
jgi:hypothetical protein